ncbi:MAG: threonylcarbamoyl-AMP synthase [Actinobacteria bacterium]|nr:threonylcarbamoyl-AMP synthase [Actinomycetota bacterium]
MIEEAVGAVRAGQVVGMPTDTVYGIGVDPLSTEAVSRLFELKGRPPNKPVGLLAATLEDALRMGDITGSAANLAREHWPGALTLVVRPKMILADWVGDAQADTVGIRVPDHPLARQLLILTGPLAVTSANRSGEEETMTAAEARAVFADEVAVYLEGESPGGLPSTVVDATGPSLRILRPGPILLEGR